MGIIRNEPPDMDFHRYRRSLGFVTSSPREVVVYNNAPPAYQQPVAPPPPPQPQVIEKIVVVEKEKEEPGVKKVRPFNIRITIK